MISSSNKPTQMTSSDDDFSEAHYRELLHLAKASYCFTTYDAIAWGSRFILWRHDVDFSLNRALALSAIEADEGIVSTYFVNLRSEGYNVFELSQARLIERILGRGHHLALHFDAAFRGIANEDMLQEQVAREARWLENEFGVRPTAFSFHNPVAAHLQCEAETYSGLINCYSKRLKDEVGYCSDSNGYWRFRRLYDVLADATEPCLQVLTHPEWWQERPMVPRQRVFRSAYGRAAAMLREYDATIFASGRVNHRGLLECLVGLKQTTPKRFELLDYLCNEEHLDLLFLELWRLHDCQVLEACKSAMNSWKVCGVEIEALLSRLGPQFNSRSLFEFIFGKCWLTDTGYDMVAYRRLSELHALISHRPSKSERHKVEIACRDLAAIVSAFERAGATRPPPADKWTMLKAQLSSSNPED